MQNRNIVFAVLSSGQTRSVVIEISYTQPYKARILSQKRSSGQYVVMLDGVEISDAENLVWELFCESVAVNKQPLPDRKQLFSYGTPYIGFVLPADNTKVGADIMLASNWFGPKKAGFVLTRQISNDDKDLWGKSTELWRDEIMSDPALKEYFSE